jgi:hypothetical protein
LRGWVSGDLSFLLKIGLIRPIGLIRLISSFPARSLASTWRFF